MQLPGPARAAAILACLLVVGCREPNGPPSAVPVAASAAAATPSPTSPPPTAPLRIDADLVRKAAAAQMCNLEYIDDAPFGAQEANARGSFRVRGWLGDASGAAPQEPVLLLESAAGDAVYRLPLALALPRPDVVQAFPGTAGLEKSGFEAHVDPAALTAGRFHLFLAYRLGARLHACDNGRQVRISQP